MRLTPSVWSWRFMTLVSSFKHFFSRQLSLLDSPFSHSSQRETFRDGVQGKKFKTFFPFSKKNLKTKKSRKWTFEVLFSSHVPDGLPCIVLWASYSSWRHQYTARLNYGRTIVQWNTGSWIRPVRVLTCPNKIIESFVCLARANLGVVLWWVEWLLIPLLKTNAGLVW